MRTRQSSYTQIELSCSVCGDLMRMDAVEVRRPRKVNGAKSPPVKKAVAEKRDGDRWFDFTNRKENFTTWLVRCFSTKHEQVMQFLSPYWGPTVIYIKTICTNGNCSNSYDRTGEVIVKGSPN